MLEIRPCCEHCGNDLPNESTDALICSFECTFCSMCATLVFQNVCPNCGGGFIQRPVRPKALLEKYPAGTKRLHKPADLDAHQKLLEQYGHIAPEQR